MSNTIRVRIAPSPTGALHIGTARTALFNWIIAHQDDGVFLLRIEDTDRDRSTPEFEQEIREALQWLGLQWDEGPFYQSDRGVLYQEAITQLLEQGDAFYCFHTPEEREAERNTQEEQNAPTRHRCDHKNLATEERDDRIHDDASFVIRFNAPDSGPITFDDSVRGTVTVEADELGDFSIAKALDQPLYNLAVVVDDHDMQITDVVRGEDHLSNTPKQILLYNALGWEIPRFAHLPLILGSDKTKLSKRHGATAVLAYRDRGYLPEAMVNFLALLGWHPRESDADEKIDREMLLETFSLDDVQKGAAVFDHDKLDWLNGRYIRSLDLEDLAERVRPFLAEADISIAEHPPLVEVLHLVRDRMTTLTDAVEDVRLFYERPDVSADLLAWKKMENSQKEVPAMLKKAIDILTEVGEEAWRQDTLETLLLEQAKEVGDGDRGMLLWPLRAALSGREASPGPHEMAAVLGKEETIARLHEALDKI